MRINSVPPNDLLSKYVHVREKTAVSQPKKAGFDRTELTSEAQTFSASLRAVKEAMQSHAPERQERIRQIAEQIRQGTYEVSGQDVAKKILGE